MKDADDEMIANRQRYLLFFELEPSNPKIDIREMNVITPMAASKAVLHTRDHGGSIEIYLTDEFRVDDGECPAIGFCFASGAYTGYGLGDDDVMGHEEDAQRTLKGVPDIDTLVEFFSSCVSP